MIDTVGADDPLAFRLAAKRHVIARATQVDGANKFDENFILNVVKEAEKEDGFAAQYSLALGGDEAAGTRASL